MGTDGGLIPPDFEAGLASSGLASPSKTAVQLAGESTKRRGLFDKMEMNLLQGLTTWYQSHCDGLWEHGYGVTIKTLDNPGWHVKIDGKSGRKDITVKIDNDDDDWLFITAGAETFRADGDPSRLEEMLERALKWVEE
jgi:hypothetical protein